MTDFGIIDSWCIHVDPICRSLFSGETTVVRARFEYPWPSTLAMNLQLSRQAPCAGSIFGGALLQGGTFALLK
jgi:hypothetical protein